MGGIWKSTFREIKSSLGRFMAIFAIIALGVGFYAGLTVSKEAMTVTVKGYLDHYGFYDYRLISTYGFEEKDVESFAAAGEVEAAEGSISFDVLYHMEDGNQGVAKTMSLPEQVNTLKLICGRMPKEPWECVADSKMFGEDDIGRQIILSEDNAEEDLEHFVCREYTIVGTVQSPLYLQYERGNTSLGTGRLSGFLYLLPEGYQVDYYTEIYVRFAQDYDLYSQEYSDFIEEKNGIWEKLLARKAWERYQDILEEAEDALSEARLTLEENREKGQEELDQAEEELQEALAELEAGEQALAEGWEEFTAGEQTIKEKERQLREARVTIAQQEAQLRDGELTIAEQESQIAEARATIDQKEAELRKGERQLIEGKAQYNSGSQMVAVARNLLNEAKNDLAEQEAQIARQKEELAAAVEAGTISPEAQAVALAAIAQGEGLIEEYRGRVAQLEGQLNEQSGQLAAAAEQISSAEHMLDTGWQAISEAENQLIDGQLALAEAKLQVAAGKEALAEAKLELVDGEKQIAEAKEELAENRTLLEEKDAELAEGRLKYQEGLEEYEKGLKEFEEKIADGVRQIAEAEAELADLEEPDTYVLGRDTNIGYVCFENDSSIIEGIANIFPIFFFLVAALVCITTMNRMVEEQRTQIGVLKALGFGEISIIFKYMTYSGLAAVTGCIFGFFFGTFGFPKVIWFCYGIMYDADPITYVFDWKLAAISMAVSLLCSIGTTWLSCRVELSQVAASLMRPKAPKAGKRVLLERIPFVWRRLGFLRKVSLRNIFRYKKRLFMMVAGISGCTALLVTGFGIKDSIADVASRQFQEIQTYDIGVTLKDSADQALEQELDALKEQGIREYICVMEKNMDLVTDKGIKSIYLVAGVREKMGPFLNLHTEDGEEVPYPGPGEAVLSNKLADDYDVRIGDMITLRDDQMRSFEVRVTGIYENYIYNYVHICEDTWREEMGQEPERKTAYLNLALEEAGNSGNAGGSVSNGQTAHELAAELMKIDQVSNVTVNADTMERIGNMLRSLDIIVVVVIFCAAGLAFIVLYNLTNINITERAREIATIKVLGFYKKETASYVFRENMMLTALGLLAGLILGHFLHALVMNEIKVDMMNFIVYVKPLSYLYSAVLTFLFAWLVDKVMGRKLECISMTESLKSVD